MSRTLHLPLASVMDMSSYEISLWEAEFKLSPWDEFRADLRAGLVASTIANVNRGKDTPAFTPAQFMPYLNRGDPEPTPDDYATLLRVFNGQ